MAIAVVVDWVGPFGSIDDSQAYLEKEGYGEGLYLAIGGGGRRRGPKYVGIAADLTVRVSPDHEKLSRLKGDMSLWVGYVASQGVPGRRAAHRSVRHSPAVDLAEWAIAYFMRLPLNSQKRRTPPPDEVVILNRWFGIRGERRHRRPHKNWPDVIDFEGRGFGASVGWIGSAKRQRHSWEEVRSLARPVNTRSVG